MNRSGHTIVNDKFLFVKDGLIRLWGHRIWGSHLHLLIHMISDSWTTQKENVQKFVSNIFIISIYGLLYFHLNTKQIFVEFPNTKDVITLEQHQCFVFEWIVIIIVYKIKVEVVSITCIGLMGGWGFCFLSQHSLCMLMASNKSSPKQWGEKECLILCCWMMCPWNLLYQP